MLVEGPRDNRGKRYAIMDLPVMTIYGIVNGHEDYANIAYFLKLEEAYFRNLLLIESTPSHDCLSNLFSMIDPKKFMEIFIEWVREAVKVKTGATIALDGKAIRSARDKINGGNTPYIISAYLTGAGISIGQVEVGSKASERKTIPSLLDLIDIEGCYVTMDAAGTYEEIAKKIVSEAKKGHYVLKVKGNQKTLHGQVKNYFAESIGKTGEIQHKSTGFERNHGRNELREYYISYNISGIKNKTKWDTVRSIGMVRVHRETNGKEEISEQHYIMDTQIEMEMFIRATRSHWNIECGLHWRPDVIMNEDRSTNKKGHSVSNLSIIRKIVFNLVRLDKSFGDVPFKRNLTRYQRDFANIENLFFNVFPAVSA
jgi:predicted transposase YbfD/YdcC